jgi:hypothetical protein
MNSPNQSDASVASFGATIQYAVVGIQGLMLGNGGAITALFALKDGSELRRFAIPAAIFGIGFVSAVACAFLSYLSQGSFTRAIGGSGEHHSNGMGAKGFAIGAALLSIACMVIGGCVSFHLATLTR